MLDYLTAASNHGCWQAADGRHSALGRFLITFVSWRQRRRQCAELYALNDRLLKDIGISRWEIEAIVNSPERDTSGRVR